MKGAILIIDDEKDIVKSMEYLLQDYVDEIHTAYNGKDAIEIITATNLHCIVCDIKMPGMTGIDVLKEVRRRKIEIPFIFYTAFGQQDLMLEALKYGAFDFVTKPNYEGLEVIVQKALRAGLGIVEGESSVERNDDMITEYAKMLKEKKTTS